MDVRQYYRKLREIETAILEDFPVIISLETTDGGKAGVASEVSRFNAAKTILEGRAILASEAETAEYRARQAAAKDAFETADLANKVQIAIVDHQKLSQLRDRKNTSPSGSGK